MKCWECNNEGTYQFEMKKAEYFMGEIFDFESVSKRWYCKECFEKISEERKNDKAEYIRLKKKLMHERAVRILERQDVELYDYKEALEAIKEISVKDPNKFDSAHEMVAAAILIDNELRTKHHCKIAGCEVDFFIPDLKAVLEIDGMFHKYSVLKDYKRDLKIRKELGEEFEVIRIDTKYIEQNAELLVEAIKSIRAEKQKIRSQNFGIIPEWFSKRK